MVKQKTYVVIIKTPLYEPEYCRQIVFKGKIKARSKNEAIDKAFKKFFDEERPYYSGHIEEEK